MILGSVGNVGMLPIGIFLMLMGTMTTDSGLTTFTWVFASLSSALPIAQVVATAASWIAWLLRRPLMTGVFICLPLAILLTLVLLFVLAVTTDIEGALSLG